MIISLWRSFDFIKIWSNISHVFIPASDWMMAKPENCE